jgi:hypothetical protein
VRVVEHGGGRVPVAEMIIDHVPTGGRYPPLLEVEADIDANGEAVTLVGEVTLLEHVSSQDIHTVRLHVANQPRLRTVRMNLTPDQYETAIEAHRSDSPLQVRGTVERQGTYNWIRVPEHVRILAQFSNDDEIPDDAIANEPDADQNPLF